MAYFEGEIPTVVSGNGYNNGGMWGQDGIWAILLLALLGNRGFGGFGGGNYGGGTFAEGLGYELGKVATTNDVASGFNNSAVLGSLNDIKLTQASNLNFINQGFAGLNNVITTGFSGVDNAICTLGYQNAQGFAGISREIAECCCGVKSAIADVKYSNERNTCDIITAINASNQRVIDYMQNEKICSLQAENVSLKGQLSNQAQSAYIINSLNPPARPAYLVPNPNCPATCGVNGFNTVI
jgi:hypothetical protein